MSLIDSIKKIFVSPFKEENIKEKEFENPLDSMPIARMPIGNGSNRYHPDPNFGDFVPQMVEQSPHHNDLGVDPDEWFIPRPEEEIADDFAIENPDESDEIEEEKMTMHEKMYRIATAKYNPFAIGGSETLGGSENRT